MGKRERSDRDIRHQGRREGDQTEHPKKAAQGEAVMEGQSHARRTRLGDRQTMEQTGLMDWNARNPALHSLPAPWSLLPLHVPMGSFPERIQHWHLLCSASSPQLPPAFSWHTPLYPGCTGHLLPCRPALLTLLSLGSDNDSWTRTTCHWSLQTQGMGVIRKCLSISKMDWNHRCWTQH